MEIINIQQTKFKQIYACPVSSDLVPYVFVQWDIHYPNTGVPTKCLGPFTYTKSCTNLMAVLQQNIHQWTNTLIEQSLYLSPTVHIADHSIDIFPVNHIIKLKWPCRHKCSLHNTQKILSHSFMIYFYKHVYCLINTPRYDTKHLKRLHAKRPNWIYYIIEFEVVSW